MCSAAGRCRILNERYPEELPVERNFALRNTIKIFPLKECQIGSKGGLLNFLKNFPETYVKGKQFVSDLFMQGREQFANMY